MQLPGTTSSTKNTPAPDIPVGPLDDSLKFFLANMAFEFTAQDVKNWFQRFGPVNHCKIIYDKTGKSKGYGFLYMMTPESFQVVQDFCSRTNHKITMLGRPQVHCQKNDENRIKNHSNNNTAVVLGVPRRSHDKLNKSNKLNSNRKFQPFSCSGKFSRNHIRNNTVMYSNHHHANRSNILTTPTSSPLTTPYSPLSTVINSVPLQSYRDRNTTTATVGNVMPYHSPSSTLSPKAYTSPNISHGTTYATAASFNYGTKLYSQKVTPGTRPSSIHSSPYTYGITQDVSQSNTCLPQGVSQGTSILSDISAEVSQSKLNLPRLSRNTSVHQGISHNSAVVSSSNHMTSSSVLKNSILLPQSNPTSSIPIATTTSVTEVQVPTNPSISHFTNQASAAFQPSETHSPHSFDTSLVTSHSTLSPYDPVLRTNPPLNNRSKHSTYTITPNPRGIIAPPSYYETASSSTSTNRELPLRSTNHLQPHISMSYPSNHQHSHVSTSLSQSTIQHQNIPPPPPPHLTPHNRSKLLLTYLPKNCEPGDIVTFFSKTYSYNIRRCTLQYDSTTSHNLGHVEFTAAEHANAVLNLAQAGHINYRGRTIGATLDWNPPPDGVQVPIGSGAPVTSSTGSFTNSCRTRMSICNGGNIQYRPY